MKKKFETVVISTPFIKLDQLLKYSGIAFTGGDAKMLIGDGLVKHNGAPASQRGKKIFPQDEVQVLVDEYTYVLKVEG